ncbi:MAG: lipopolysaccharide heptosyltransferase II [Deltaproteobacteria bacterium HGW-Deltaproteobacteria-15]|jgi:heptosyltransferase-2|nr:MAG: lipopolysaccharide heptosyltransferase II [Deltaproteobacteria bacterium HGW-Deltaproteobacteria-15]
MNVCMTIDRSKIRRVLVRAPNWVGDAIMALPSLEALKENLPGSSVVVLAKPWVIPVFENHPCVDSVLHYRKDVPYPRALLRIMSTASELRRLKFDLAFLLQNAFEAALLAWLAGIPYRLGYNTDGRSLLLSHPVPKEKDRQGHQVEYYMGILKSMNWRVEPRDPRLHVNGSKVSAARSLLLSYGIKRDDFLLGMAPGATYGPAKRWPPEKFAAVADMAAEKWGAKVVVMGSGNEQTIGDAVVLAMRSPALNLCGKTSLGEAAAVIQQCRAFLTNDSGLMHLAAALDVPTVAVFGSTDPTATGPRSEKARVVRHPMECSPCLKPECPEGCPCLKSIQPDEVWKELVSCLRST